MKKAVQAFIRSLGGSSNYAGNTESWKENTKGDGYDITRHRQTLFINDPHGNFEIETAVHNKFGLTLPFTLKTN